MVNLFQTTMNTCVLNAWLEQNFLPKLPEKNVVIIDYATFHKGKEMQKDLTGGDCIVLISILLRKYGFRKNFREDKNYAPCKNYF